jgi:hypothetical protein
MGDNGFSEFMKRAESPFRLFAAETMLPVFGNSNASATSEASTQAPSATEPAASGASELPFGPCQYLTCMHRPNEAGCARPETMRTCRHQWLRPVDGEIECALCSKVRWAQCGE